MKILVIGGSYFFGRWFIQIAHKNHSITVLNRGSIPINLPGVIEWKSDRHDEEALNAFPKEQFDCIVDFCAYNPQDIEIIAKIFGNPECRYLFISTVDVYKKKANVLIDEASELETNFLPGDVGAYINGKVHLEKELIEVCSKYSMNYSSIRPAILYGPANYAPRESIYFGWINQAGQIIVPSDSDSQFQLIYILDAAKGILKLCELDKEELKHAYNFCSSTTDSYSSFHAALHKAVDKEFVEIPASTKEILESNIPLPFPLTKEESAIYSGKLFEELDIDLTSLEEGLSKTYKSVQ